MCVCRGMYIIIIILTIIHHTETHLQKQNTIKMMKKTGYNLTGPKSTTLTETFSVKIFKKLFKNIHS